MKHNAKHGGRFSARSIILLVLAFVLVIGASVGGTLAWLTAKTDPVVNTFTSAALFANPTTDFTLWEYKAEELSDGSYKLNSTEDTANTYKVLPGVEIPKNPTVDVNGLQESAYLYIVVKEDTLPTTMTYAISDDWTPISTGSNVYYYTGDLAVNGVITPSDADHQTFTVEILENNKIVVDAKYAPSTTSWSLKFEAYMTQATGQESAAQAWADNFAD